MALGPFSISYDRSKVVDYSKTIYIDSFGIFLPRPRLEKDLTGFTKPLAREVQTKLYLLIHREISYIYGARSKQN